MPPADVLVHATAVESAGTAILISGPSGSGKSDLALRLIAWPTTGLGLAPFTLVSDDQVQLTRQGGSVIARAPETIAGHIEVRGLGILPMAHTAQAAVRLVVQLSPAEAIERLPDRESLSLASVALPAIRLFPFEPSAPIKAALALREVLSRAAG